MSDISRPHPITPSFLLESTSGCGSLPSSEPDHTINRKRFFHTVKTSTLQWHRVFQPGPCYTHEEEFSAAANIHGTRQGPP